MIENIIAIAYLSIVVMMGALILAVISVKWDNK